MATRAIVFDRVWKKFARGERHDSLRDLIPALARRALGRAKRDELGTEEFWALRDVSFDVHPGQALGIIGPNGAGKSTTLKLLTRILRPTRGSCSVRGRVGALIEIAAGFHADLTGRENVYLQGAIMGMKRAEIARKFDEIVEFASLGAFIDTPVKRYSSGMNARLGFSVAAHLDPDVLLIDEVLAVGDFTFQQKCYQRLEDFRRAGIAIAFVSHNMQAIASLCDRAMLLRPDREPLIGPVADVTMAYASRAAASSDARVALVDARLSAAGEREPLARPVAPGTVLTVDVTVQARTDLPRCGLGILVTRSDGLVVFQGASNIDADQVVDLKAGQVLQCAVTFTAHVLRGTYLVSAFLLDSQRLWSKVDLTGIGTFVITETSRMSGCTELDPRYVIELEETDGTAPAYAAGAHGRMVRPSLPS